jgi:hypothetical protein
MRTGHDVFALERERPLEIQLGKLKNTVHHAFLDSRTERHSLENTPLERTP